jgi:hypothetical protein
VAEMCDVLRWDARVWGAGGRAAGAWAVAEMSDTFRCKTEV